MVTCDGNWWLTRKFFQVNHVWGKAKKNKIDLYTLNVLFSVRYINIVKMLIKKAWIWKGTWWYTYTGKPDWKTCTMQCHDLRLHGLLISACPHPPLAVSLPQLKSPGSCSSHVASSARPESAHPPILLPWHFQENPSRLGAWLINPRERGRKGRGGGRECYADLAGIVLSAGSIRASEAHCNW